MSSIDLSVKRRWLFCLTHPDDEISICILIKRLVDSGHDVAMSWTHSPGFRLREGHLGAKLLGVPLEHCFAHGSTDGSTCEELIDLMPSFRAMMDSYEPDVVVCGAFEQGHLDHDATNWLVNQTFSGPVWEVPFYHSYIRPKIQRINQFSDPSGQEVLALTPTEQRFKLEFAKQFRSQNIWSVLLLFEVVSVVLLRPAGLRRRELLRQQRHFDFRRPNHPEALARRIELTPQWRRWLAAMDNVEGSLS